jgi:hypothetical protein
MITVAIWETVGACRNRDKFRTPVSSRLGLASTWPALSCSEVSSRSGTSVYGIVCKFRLGLSVSMVGAARRDSPGFDVRVLPNHFQKARGSERQEDEDETRDCMRI